MTDGRFWLPEDRGGFWYAAWPRPDPQVILCRSRAHAEDVAVALNRLNIYYDVDPVPETGDRSNA